MRKQIILVLLMLTLCLTGAAAAEEIDAFGLSVDTGITILDFDDAQIDVTDAKALAKLIDQLPCLTDVLMFDSTMEQTDMEWLYEQYPDIFFGFTLHLYTHTIRTDVTAFSTLHMASPTKDDPRHTSEELYILRLCKKLKALDIGHNTLTDLNFLYFLPDIEVLIVSPNYGLTDISPIATCKNLVYLECFNTPFTDLSPLSGMEHLRDLNLTRCSMVSDLSPLYELPSLERFWWGEMGKIRVDQKRIMREKHPNCKFVNVYNPTEGGWRNHPHQKEQMEFFRTGVYVPFAE